MLTKKLLFVTNKQARMFDLGDMDRFIQAFDVTPKPKLVINLFPSFATHIASQPFMHHWSGLKGDFGDHHFHCEVDKRSLHETDRKIGMFLKKCRLQPTILFLHFPSMLALLAHCLPRSFLIQKASCQWLSRPTQWLYCIISIVASRTHSVTWRAPKRRK